MQPSAKAAENGDQGKAYCLSLGEVESSPWGSQPDVATDTRSGMQRQVGGDPQMMRVGSNSGQEWQQP